MYVPKTHPKYLAFELRWAGGDSYALSQQDAENLITKWRKGGVVTGTLENYDIAYVNDFGRRATITRYMGQQHRLDSIDPVTGAVR